MAKIELQPQEHFEHYHSDVSKTEALTDNIRIKIGEAEQDLPRGAVVTVPAQTPHVVINCGDTPAAVSCWH